MHHQCKSFDADFRQLAKTRNVGAAGIEPSFVIDATVSVVCDCENCQRCRAAYARHLDCFELQFLASLDTALQCLIERWESLDTSTQRTIASYCRQRTAVGNR